MCEALFSESADLVVRLSYHCKRCECIANVVWMTGWTRPGKEPIKATATNCPNISCLVSAPRSSICSAVTPGPAQRSQLGCLLDTILELSTALCRKCEISRSPVYITIIYWDWAKIRAVTVALHNLQLFTFHFIVEDKVLCPRSECPLPPLPRCPVLTQVICLCCLFLEM